uniref:Uncharacterized protein n=1 Tax=Knipowitschia caucasica TaxID=637954 RepID=A0AAV2K2H5_KNICA
MCFEMLPECFDWPDFALGVENDEWFCSHRDTSGKLFKIESGVVRSTLKLSSGSKWTSERTDSSERSQAERGTRTAGRVGAQSRCCRWF